MEILGRPWSEETLLRVAYQIERVMKVRRIPRLAEQVVEVRDYDEVPVVTPQRGNIPREYPVGVL